jgi:rubrerythrin
MSDARMTQGEGLGGMGVSDYLPGLGTRDTSFVYRECRSCGMSLEEDHDQCPSCDGEVVTYEL